MAHNPLNLALRFLLEIVGLVALGYWGWHQGEGFWRFVLALLLPLVAAALWGTFRVPDDPGKAPVPIPGWLRLVLEFLYFTLSAAALLSALSVASGLTFGLVVLAHYAVSYDRIVWLLKQ